MAVTASLATKVSAPLTTKPTSSFRPQRSGEPESRDGERYVSSGFCLGSARNVEVPDLRWRLSGTTECMTSFRPQRSGEPESRDGERYVSSGFCLGSARIVEAPDLRWR